MLSLQKIVEEKTSFQSVPIPYGKYHFLTVCSAFYLKGLCNYIQLINSIYFFTSLSFQLKGKEIQCPPTVIIIFIA